MVDYEHSSQLNQWLFKSPVELEICRSKANLKAREYLLEMQSKQDNNNDNEQLPVDSFACGFSLGLEKGTEERINYSTTGPLQTDKGHAFLTPSEEATLVSFYASKLHNLIGPQAQVSRLRRESKVTATAALLLRRFFLSNSVMLYDPKTIMVAAAFLAAKVEDATADVRYLEQGTSLMNAPVVQNDIIVAEVALIAGIHFDLTCFHPFRAVVALTEDLRTFLKTKQGQSLVSTTTATNTSISGKDLKPLYDQARLILDQVIVSDIPLLYSPGQVGLAALMWAQQQATNDGSLVHEIDFMGYIQVRFPQQAETSESWMGTTCLELMQILSELEQHGCVPTTDPQATQHLATLKGIHKKLKKVRAWGTKKKKRTNENNDTTLEPATKRTKTEA